MSQQSFDGNEPVWKRQINNILETQISRYPFLVQMRAVLRQLQDERANWSVLLPLLSALFIIVYRSERKKIKAILRDLAD